MGRRQQISYEVCANLPSQKCIFCTHFPLAERLKFLNPLSWNRKPKTAATSGSQPVSIGWVGCEWVVWTESAANPSAGGGQAALAEAAHGGLPQHAAPQRCPSVWPTAWLPCLCWQRARGSQGRIREENERKMNTQRPTGKSRGRGESSKG